ncbi:Hypp7637 [Branchiostoma lanceolatum]|uniref:Hypp7637 protein n=1 Tax=Branchiostoma lanceolatum TaxID=7740 RepID=A0A8K0EBG2_BRALA|nr:Hypp7637 [Branchiostoma lanceolatum]
MKIVLLFAFVAAANAAWLCPNGDADCDPGECCIRSFLVNSCQPMGLLHDACNNEGLSISGYCDCADGLICADYGTSAFTDFFVGDGWCLPAPTTTAANAINDA